MNLPVLNDKGFPRRQCDFSVPPSEGFHQNGMNKLVWNSPQTARVDGRGLGPVRVKLQRQRSPSSVFRSLSLGGNFVVAVEGRFMDVVDDGLEVVLSPSFRSSSSFM